MRGARALVTSPKGPTRAPVVGSTVSLWIFPLGFKNCAWLKTLKNSARISKAFASVTGILLLIPKSVLLMPGPWKNRWLAVPKVPQSGLQTPALYVQLVGANALASKYVYVPGVSRGSWMWIGPTRFGISIPCVPRSEESVEL